MLSIKFDAEFFSKNISTVKTTLSKVLLTAVIGCILLAIASCKRGSCGKIITTVGGQINSIIFDSTKLKISIFETKIEKEGDIKWGKKDPPNCYFDELSKDLLTLSCNKNLQLKTEQINAGDNLIQSRFIVPTSKKYFGEAFILELSLSDSFASGDYTFILGGTTKEGKTVNDTAIITY